MMNKDHSFDLGVRWRVPNARQYAFACTIGILEWWNVGFKQEFHPFNI